MLTVDQTMIKKSWLYFSRNPNELVEKFLNTQKRKPDLERPKKSRKKY